MLASPEKPYLKHFNAINEVENVEAHTLSDNRLAARFRECPLHRPDDQQRLEKR